MDRVNIMLPLQLPEGHGFFNVREAAPMRFGTYELGILVGHPDAYLLLMDVPLELAQETVDKVRIALRWASLRFGWGIRTSDRELRHEEGLIIDGQFPTTFKGAPRTPARVSASMRTEDGDVRLFHYLNEGGTVLCDPAEPLGRS